MADSTTGGTSESRAPDAGTERDTVIPDGLDTGVPHIARIYDYWLGGKDNFEADRVVAERVIATAPSVTASVRTNRAFLSRAVHHLAAVAGVRQFLDIGTGLPSADNTHEVAQRTAPSSRIVYVDNDPIVLLHARALLTSAPEGRTAYLDADVRDPTRILAAAADILDFSEPVALMLVAVMHSVPDEDDPYGIVETLAAALPAGSYLVLSHAANDVNPTAGAAAGVNEMNRTMPDKVTLRNHAAVSRFFHGWDLLDPGVVPATRWRTQDDRATVMWAGVARKPARPV